MSKKGYWIAMVDIADAETYRDYVAANAAAFEKYGARFHVRGGRSHQPEGPAGQRQVVIEFDSFETAIACYESPEYQAALKIRQACASARFAIVEGV